MNSVILSVGTLVVLFLIVMLRDWDSTGEERVLKFILVLIFIDIIFIIKLLEEMI